MKLIGSQVQFNGGEFSPRMYARTDLSQYEKGLETETNAYSTVHGPAIRRNGSKFVAVTKDSTKATKLLRFQFAKDDGVIIEAGDSYFRFYTSSGQIVNSASTITGITQANPAVVTTSAAHGLSNGDQVYIESIVGMTELNDSNIPYQVANVTPTTFEVQDYDGTNVNSSAYTAYSSGGTATGIYTLTTPWDETEVDDLSYAQYGDLVYIAHPDYEPRVLTRTSNSVWTLSTLSAAPAPTYESGYAPDTTVTPAATTGSAVNFTAGAATWLEADIGRQIINSASNETGIAIITSITSSTVAVCNIVEAFTDTNAIASGDWKMDLSPICDLEFQGTAAGQIVTVTSRYPVGYTDNESTITGITKANPGVVTSNGHPFADGDEVEIKDVVGMSSLNGNLYRVTSSTTNTFALQSENTSGYNTYTSGGTASKLQEDNKRDAFRSADVDRFIKVAGGVLKILSVTSATQVVCEVLKSLSSDDRTGNWTLETEAWTASRGYPRAVGIFGERLIFGGTSAQPQTLWFSESGIFDGFGIGVEDADAISIDLTSKQVNQINWIASARDIIVGTEGGELTVNGGNTGVAITPSNISALPRRYHGSQRQQPIAIGDEVIFLQSAGRKVRTFRYDFNIDNYRAEDLTFLSEHISEGGLTELAYSQEPDSIIYAITSNGELLAGVYERLQEVIAWSRYSTDGDYENVQAISVGEEDQVWTVVEREINSNTRRYIEYFDYSTGEDDLDLFSDCSLTLSDNYAIIGLTSANPGVVTTSSAHGLSNGDKVIIKDLVDGPSVDLDSAKTNMSTLNNKTFTVANKTSTTFELSGIDTSNYNTYSSGGNVWLKVTTISGLSHIEGKSVEIKTDGASHPAKTVSSGAITLDRSAGEVTVGLPYTTTLKTLRQNFDLGSGPMQGQRVRRIKPILRVYQSAIPLLGDQVLPARSSADEMDQKLPLYSGDLFYGPTGFDNNGQLTITLTGPFPLRLQGIYGTIEGNLK